MTGGTAAAANPDSDTIDPAVAVGGAAVGIVGGAAAIMGIAQLVSNVRPQNQNRNRNNRNDRDKEPPEEELRERIPSPSSPDDIEKLRKKVRFDSDSAAPPNVDMDTALFAFRPEDVTEIRRILAEHGTVYEIIRAPK